MDSKNQNSNSDRFNNVKKVEGKLDKKKSSETGSEVLNGKSASESLNILSQNFEELVAQYVHAGTQRLIGGLQRVDLHTIRGAASRYSKKYPTLVIVGAAVIGLAVGLTYLKTSSNSKSNT